MPMKRTLKIPTSLAALVIFSACNKTSSAFALSLLASNSRHGASLHTTRSSRRNESPQLSTRLLRGGSSTSALNVHEKQTNADNAVESSAKYHLVWSPGFTKKLLSSTLVLFALRFILIRMDMTPQFMIPHCHSRATATVSSSPLSRLTQLLLLPLLSSSCCALQLIINAVGMGCAGFNTFLGPIRPYVLSFLLYSTLISFPVPGAIGLRQWMRTAAASFIIASMPEMLHIWNGRAEKVSRTKISRTLDMKTAATVEVTIPSMGCVACINKVDASIRQCNPQKIMESRSWLTEDPKGGRARFVLAADSVEDVESVVDAITKSVSKAGFPCSVDSVVVADTSK